MKGDVRQLTWADDDGSHDDSEPLEPFSGQWIWVGEPKPDNGWVAFRRTFHVANSLRSAKIRVSADSRYVLWLNGTRIGQGPVRSWTQPWYYDEYECASELEVGDNLLLITVVHPGVSTFQSVRSRGGLWAALTMWTNEGHLKEIVTDDLWQGSLDYGWQRNSPRISCQQGYVELVDGRQRLHASWERARPLGKVGIGPWGRLNRRPIPLLAQTRVFPEKVMAQKGASQLALAHAVELRGLLTQGDTSANPVEFAPRWLATQIHLPVQQTVTFYRLNTGLVADSWLNHEPVRWHPVTPLSAVWSAQRVLHAGDYVWLSRIVGPSNRFNWSFGIQEPGVSLRPVGDQGSPWVLGQIPDNLTLERVVDLGWAELKTVGTWLDVPAGKIWTDDGYLQAASARAHMDSPSDVHQMDNPVEPGLSLTVDPVDSGQAVQVVVDFGREVSGYWNFEVSAHSGVIIDLAGIEVQQNGELLFPEALYPAMQYITCEGRQQVESVIRRGCRYLILTIRNHQRHLSITSLHCLEVTYPILSEGSLSTDNAIANKLYTMSALTTRLCMEDTFVDCPAYEQALWVGDLRVEALVAYALFGESRLVRHSLELIGQSLDRGDGFRAVVPTDWDRRMPAWTLLWIITIGEYWNFSGDQAALERFYPWVALVLESFLSHGNTIQLLESRGNNMIDWAPMEVSDHGVVTAINALFVWCLKTGQHLAAAIGRPREAQRWQRERTTLIAAMHRFLWNDEMAAYADEMPHPSRPATFSQQTQTLAYLAGAVPKNRETQVSSWIVDPPRGTVISGTPWMEFFVCEARMKLSDGVGQLDEALGRWQTMMGDESTTFWETFADPKSVRPTRSFCHGWSAGPAYFLVRHGLGVRSVIAGGRVVWIDPALDQWRSAQGRVPVPQGEIEVHWRAADDNAAELTVKLPQGVSGILAPRWAQRAEIYQGQGTLLKQGGFGFQGTVCWAISPIAQFGAEVGS